VDATLHVNGGCRALNNAGTEWEYYIGEAAAAQRIISQGCPASTHPTPGVGREVADRRSKQPDKFPGGGSTHGPKVTASHLFADEESTSDRPNERQSVCALLRRLQERR
jgi:hypothetical protein